LVYQSLAEVYKHCVYKFQLGLESIAFRGRFGTVVCASWRDFLQYVGKLVRKDFR
jgi:hypothetical protein